MLRTKNDLSQQTRSQVIPLLNARLADGIDLQYQAKQAHWNVKGNDFFQLHELFDKVAHDVRKHVDEIAERIAQLGGNVEGTVRKAAQRSSLDEYPSEIFDGLDHVDALSRALATFTAACRKAIDDCGELGDMATADLFTQVTRTADELLWMVEAHVQAPGERREMPMRASAPGREASAHAAAQQRRP